MLKLLALVLILALLLLLVVTIVRAASGRGRWRVGEHAEPDGTIVVVVTRLGQPPVPVASIPAELDPVEFFDRLADARSEAQRKAAALNARVPRSSR